MDELDLRYSVSGSYIVSKSDCRLEPSLSVWLIAQALTSIHPPVESFRAS